MKEKPENFTDGIHNDDYEDEYLQTRLNASRLVNITGRETESLNGKWNFGVDLYDTCRRSHWWREERFGADGRELPVDYDWESWEYITVPSCWNLQKDELCYYEGCGVYTRTFRYFPRARGERLLLRFEGAAYRTTVFLNGKIIGTHDGASTPFNADITDIVRKDNRIVVSVDASRSPVRVPMHNTDWFNYGGIYRDIYLVRLPPIYIKDWFVRLAPDENFSTVLADVYLAGADGTQEVRMEIPELGICQDIPVENGRGEVSVSVKPELWSPENPKLYDVIFTYNAGSCIDTTRDRIGFRTISVKGQEIFLNGKKIFLSWCLRSRRSLCVR